MQQTYGESVDNVHSHGHPSLSLLHCEKQNPFFSTITTYVEIST
jgi:hypothetical protein